MAVQLSGTIFIGALAGKYLDQRLGNQKPYFTVGLCVFATLASMYLIIKDIIQDSQ